MLIHVLFSLWRRVARRDAMEPGCKDVRLISVDEVPLFFLRNVTNDGAAGVVQRHVCYLGEINDTQELTCGRAIARLCGATR
jgi:hypothetical protein